MSMKLSLTLTIFFLSLTLALSFIPSSISPSKWLIRSTVEEPSQTTYSVLLITDKALQQLRNSKQEGKCLRIGVKSGGCSGMSYTMDFVDVNSVTEADHIEYIEDIKCLIDPKSLLFIYGLQLDYSNELIGGCFQFGNPNAKV